MLITMLFVCESIIFVFTTNLTFFYSPKGFFWLFWVSLLFILQCIRFSDTGSTHWCRASILSIIAEVPRVQMWHLENSWCRCLSIFAYLSPKKLSLVTSNCLKHHFFMVWIELILLLIDINKCKIHINIDGKNYAAYADDVLVELYINSHIVNNKLVMKCFSLNCSVEILSMRTDTLVFLEVVKYNSLCVTTAGTAFWLHLVSAEFLRRHKSAASKNGTPIFDWPPVAKVHRFPVLYM